MLHTSTVGEDADTVIDRFLEVVAAGDGAPHRLADAGGFIGYALGGDLADYFPLGDDDVPPPDSMMAELQAAGFTVSPDEWIGLLRRRLRSMVDEGVDAVFLVRSLATYVTDWCRTMADTGPADDRRAKTRADLYAIADDPEKLASYRSTRDADDPSRAAQSDDEVAALLRRTADKLAPISPDTVARMWSTLATWERDVAYLFADDAQPPPRG